MFPKELDDISIDVLVDIAEKSIEIDRIYEQLAQNKIGKDMNSIQKEDIQGRLNKLKKTLKTRKLDAPKTDEKFQSCDLFDSEDFFDHNFSESIKCEQKIQKIKAEILEIQIAEIKRLTRECSKSGKSVKNIASYIVGTDNIDKFMVYTHKEIKNIQTVRERIKTFSFSSRLLPQQKVLISPRSVIINY